MSSLAALLCRLSVSKSSRDEFHVLRLCEVRGVKGQSPSQRLLGKGLGTEGLDAGLHSTWCPHMLA